MLLIIILPEVYEFIFISIFTHKINIVILFKNNLFVGKIAFIIFNLLLFIKKFIFFSFIYVPIPINTKCTYNKYNKLI